MVDMDAFGKATRAVLFLRKSVQREDEHYAIDDIRDCLQQQKEMIRIEHQLRHTQLDELNRIRAELRTEHEHANRRETVINSRDKEIAQLRAVIQVADKLPTLIRKAWQFLDNPSMPLAARHLAATIQHCKLNYEEIRRTVNNDE